jgi:hypothetical protein
MVDMSKDVFDAGRAVFDQKAFVEAKANIAIVFAER